MSTTRRLATLTLAASAALGLAACSTSIEAKGVPSSQEQADLPVQEAGDTDAAEPTETEPTATEPVETEPPTTSTTGDEDLPVPGDGIPGDAGLCSAVVGWFGYAGLSLIAVDENGNIDPDDIVPLLEAMRDAPADHQDASGDLLDAAADVSDATDEVIGQIESGANTLEAFSSLEQPLTTFSEACVARGVQV